MTIKARIAVFLAVALIAGLCSNVAFGFWSGAGTAGKGGGATGAASLNQGAAPTARETGSTTVIVSWGGSGLSNGVPADGYIVKRFAEATGAQATIGAGCAGTIAASTCTESGTPEGSWEYTVTPVVAANWRGAESVKSGAVNTGPGSLSLARSLFGGTVAPLPAVVSGTVSGFAPNQAIAFFLDGSPLAGSPAQVATNGGATISMTLPAGTADGPHTLAVRSATTEASSGILVDNAPPTIEVIVIPPPNAAGWNRTAPVEVGGTVNDGNGSGVAFAKYTEDDSDPKISSTAKYETEGPVSVSTTKTLKFFLADNAGNESPVETQLVKIDTTEPVFTVDLAEVHGGAYVAPANLETGEPGNAYYRGAAAGSFRFLMTPIPLGGSAAVSAGFSELPPDAFGFSFDSSSVTMPVGGPFLSNPFSWVAGTASTPAGTISLTNEAGSTFGSAGAIHNDSTPPTGGSVDAAGLAGTGGRYSTTLELKLKLAKGIDFGSGLADGTGPSDLPDKLERASAPLSTSNGIAEGSCGTYSAFAQVGTDNPAASITDTVPTDNSCYLYRYLVSDHVGNVATYTSPAIKVQTVSASALRPTDAMLTPISGTGSQSVSGSTVFYNPARSGSFNVESSASSPYSGVAQVTFPTITGFSGGGAVAAPVTGTVFRSTYSWSANGANASPGVQPISATNNAGQTATNPSAFTVAKDSSGPSGGSVDATGLVGTGARYSTSTTLSIAFTPGTDAGSGLAAGGAQLLRASASLTSEGGANGACGTFGPYIQVGANDPSTPRSDTVPADRTCYRYEYIVSDKVGNQTTYLSPEIKVDATAPSAPALSFSAPTNAYWSGTGTTVFYRPGAASGGFQLTATSADTTAGISGYAFPTLPTGWSSISGGSGIRNYAWSAANPVAPTGTQTVTVTNNAGRGASSTFTATPDSTVPTGGSLAYTNGYSGGSTVSISFTKGTDTISGLDSASGIIEGSTATFAAGACGTFGAFAVVATNPASGVSLPVTSGTCYEFRYSIADNVGNRSTYNSASVTKVDSVAPVDSLSLEGAVNSSQTGNTIYYRGSVAGSFKVVDAPTDASSGPASSTFPAIATTGWTHEVETIGTPTGGPYVSSPFSWTAGAANPTVKPVFSTDLAGKSSTNASLLFASDIVAPSGGSIAYANGVVDSTSVPITTVNGSDVGSGINTATTTTRRDLAPLNTATETCGTFPGTYATTVTLVAGADAGVTSGNCYRYEYIVSDKVGNQAVNTSASVAKIDTGGPHVTAIESRQSSGSAGNGKLEVGDKLIVTLNQALATGSVPTSFSGATETSPGVLVDVNLAIPGITNGSLDTGTPFYLLAPSTTATFGGSVALANNGAATTLTIVVTTLSGGTTSAGSGTLIFKPAPTITDGGGNAAAGTFNTSGTFKLF